MKRLSENKVSENSVKSGKTSVSGRKGAEGFSGTDNAAAQEYALKIMEALSAVDQELLEKSGGGVSGKQARKPVWRWAETCAAALCLIAVGAASWNGYRLIKNVGQDNAASGGMHQEMLEALDEGGNNRPEAAPESMADEDETDGETNAAAGEKPGLSEEQKSISGDTAAGGSSGDGINDRIGEQSGESGPESEKAENEAQKENGRENGPQPTGLPETDSQQDNGFFPESTEEGGSNSTVSDKDEEGQDLSGCLKLEAEKYTEEEARNLEELGKYIPDTLPEGYAFSDAYSDLALEQQNLTVCWTKGMDSIIIHLEKAEETVSTVDVERTECYDVRLYEIPYGETVPSEYREIFDNPVFALEDFDLEIVRSRMKILQDSGDTATPRGNFGVLYPGNVTADFSGRGTAEEIWEMFCSMGN